MVYSPDESKGNVKDPFVKLRVDHLAPVVLFRTSTTAFAIGDPSARFLTKPLMRPLTQFCPSNEAQWNPNTRQRNMAAPFEIPHFIVPTTG
jgi:hypothetical protein